MPSLGGGADVEPRGDEVHFDTSTEVVFGLDSQFELIGELGQGGFGKVFQVRHRLLGHMQAVKRLRSRSGQTPEQAAEARSRFLLEARALMKLEHPGIVKLIDCREDKYGLYLVMEYIAGGALHRVLEDGRQYSVGETIELGLQLCEALQFAHNAGVIHRDIKPANILLTSSHQPKLTDFGLARIHDTHAAAMHSIVSQMAGSSRLQRSMFTESNIGMGTPGFMAPEQRKSANKADARSDVFSLGRTLYCMNTGELPEMLDMGLVPDPLRSVLTISMSSHPERRYQSMLEFAAALREVAAFQRESRTSATPASPRAPAGGTATSPASNENAGPRLDTALLVPHSVAAKQEPVIAHSPVDSIMAEVHQALEKYDYSAAASFLEHIPAALRDQKLHAECVAKRDRVAELRRLVRTKKPIRVLRAAVDELLQLQPDRSDVLRWQDQIEKHAERHDSEKNERSGDESRLTLPPKPVVKTPTKQATAEPIVFEEASSEELPVQRASQTGSVKQRVATPSVPLPVDWTNSIGLRMKLIQPGTFQMGDNNGVNDEKPVHQVTISRAFYCGVYPVTQAEYQAATGLSPSHFKGAKRPVERVSWDNAMSFCVKLNEKEQSRPLGLIYRLLSEAEWEYCCRAGISTPWCCAREDQLGKYAWYNSPNDLSFLKMVGIIDWAQSRDVGMKRANGWGLHDMHGNVWEWVLDGKGSYSGGAVKDPVNLATASGRVARGGCWGNDAANCRSACRGSRTPDHQDNGLGFRLALGPELK